MHSSAEAIGMDSCDALSSVGFHEPPSYYFLDDRSCHPWVQGKYVLHQAGLVLVGTGEAHVPDDGPVVEAHRYIL